MSTYIALANWTPEGIRAVENAADRLDAVKKLMADMDCRYHSIHMTMGEYDFVLIYNGPDEPSPGNGTPAIKRRVPVMGWDYGDGDYGDGCIFSKLRRVASSAWNTFPGGTPQKYSNYASVTVLVLPVLPDTGLPASQGSASSPPEAGIGISSDRRWSWPREFPNNEAAVLVRHATAVPRSNFCGEAFG